MKMLKIKWIRNEVEIRGELHSFVNTSNGLMAIIVVNKSFRIVNHYELTVI
jgi:hypothetical protein